MEANPRLTTRQNELTRIGKIKGSITLSDVRRVYSTPNIAKNAIERLVEMNYFKPIDNGTFEFIA